MRRLRWERRLCWQAIPERGNPLDAIAETRLAFERIAPRFDPDATVTPSESMADGFRSAAVILGDPPSGWRDRLPDRLGIALMLDGTRFGAPPPRWRLPWPERWMS